MNNLPTQYFLMHKDIKVCLMDISENGELRHIRRNAAVAEHFPIGGQMNDIKFHDWWRDRAIPKTRHGVKPALQKLGYSSTNSALLDNLALSLTDCYWIMPFGEDISWKEINLFTNDFVDSFGELTLNPTAEIDLRKDTKFNFATSQGELQKKWCIANDGRRYMIKGNFGNSYQQSLNEIFATELHKKQNFSNYTTYNLVKLRTTDGSDGLGCMSYDFCGEEIECISAWELLQTQKLRQNQSLYHPFRDICLSLGMSQDDFDNFIDYEIMTDYLLTNTDRHMNNIAIMRNPDTLKILGFAPIYDSGNSMFYNRSYSQLNSVRLDKIETHSFIKSETQLLSYVHDRTLVDIDAAAEIDFSIYEKDIEENQIRIPRLKELYMRKIESLKSFQNGNDIWKSHY